MSLAGAAQVLRGCDVAFPVVHGPARRGRHPRGAVRPGDPALRRVAARRGCARDGQVGHQAGRRARSASRPRPAGWSRARTAEALDVDRSGRREAGRGGLEPGRLAGRTSRADLRPALDAAFALDSRVLVEEVVSGREIDVAVLRRADGSILVPPALEIVGDRLFDYDAKYGGHAVFHVPAPLTETDAKALEDAATAMYDALGCSGVARVDFFLTDGRAGPQRGQHDPGDDRALAGAADVRRRRPDLSRPARRARAWRPPVTPRMVR